MGLGIIPFANDETKPAKAPKPKVEGQREMLPPIAGGKAEAGGDETGEGFEAAAEGRMMPMGSPEADRKAVEVTGPNRLYRVSRPRRVRDA